MVILIVNGKTVLYAMKCDNRLLWNYKWENSYFSWNFFFLTTYNLFWFLCLLEIWHIGIISMNSRLVIYCFWYFFLGFSFKFLWGRHIEDPFPHCWKRKWIPFFFLFNCSFFFIFLKNFLKIWFIFLFTFFVKFLFIVLFFLYFFQSCLETL